MGLRHSGVGFKGRPADNGSLIAAPIVLTYCVLVVCVCVRGGKAVLVVVAVICLSLGPLKVLCVCVCVPAVRAQSRVKERQNHTGPLQLLCII